MIKVTVTNKDSIVLSPAYFQNETLADEWIALNGNNGCWGKPERWVSEGDEDISEALESRDIEVGPDHYTTEYKLAAEFSVAKLDVANEPSMEQLRMARNGKLAECDWTQLADAPLSSEEKAAWATYRQELRDLPENTENPLEPVWPEMPES